MLATSMMLCTGTSSPPSPWQYQVWIAKSIEPREKAELFLFPVLLVGCLFFVPRSPYFLLSKGKTTEARDALQWFRGKSYDCDEEWKEMLDKQKEMESMETVPFMTIITKKQYLAPFLIVLTLMFLQQFSGINAILFYVQTIFMDAGSSMDPGNWGILFI